MTSICELVCGREQSVTSHRYPINPKGGIITLANSKLIYPHVELVQTEQSFIKYNKNAKQVLHTHILITTTSNTDSGWNSQIPKVQTRLSAYLHLIKSKPMPSLSILSLLPSPSYN